LKFSVVGRPKTRQYEKSIRSIYKCLLSVVGGPRTRQNESVQV
jgi:hypothetical protein